MKDNQPNNVQLNDYELSIEEIIERLTQDEIRRMYRNLKTLDALELFLFNNIKTQYDANGHVDNETLQKAMAAFNKSVERSNSIVKDRNQTLVQVLIDARSDKEPIQTVNPDVIDTEEKSALTLRGRKRLRSVFEAFLEDERKEKDDIQDEEEK